METTVAEEGGPAPTPTYWPTWTSVALLASGLIVVAFETYSWLVLVGLGFALAGVYGLLHRRTARVSVSADRGIEGRPGPEGTP